MFNVLVKTETTPNRKQRKKFRGVFANKCCMLRPYGTTATFWRKGSYLHIHVDGDKKPFRVRLPRNRVLTSIYTEHSTYVSGLDFPIEIVPRKKCDL